LHSTKAGTADVPITSLKDRLELPARTDRLLAKECGMIRYQKWMSLIALSLTLTWQTSRAEDKSSAPKGSPTPARVADQSHRHAEIKVASRPYDDDDTTRDSDTNDGNDSSSSYGDEINNSDERTTIPQDAQESDDASTAKPTVEGENVEIIKERYPDGAIKIEREVTQDAQGNYINHGSWKMWDKSGNPVAQGEFRYGNRTGTWVRWYHGASEADLLQQIPYRLFAGPFISQATFEHGQLNGTWNIYDGKKRKISQWGFTDGKRHGASIWWFPNGKKMREVQYRDGLIDGQLIETSSEGTVTANYTYQEGRKLAQKTSTYNGGAKKSQGMYLYAKDIEQSPDDWWTGKLMVTTKAGKDEKQGAWISWHSNGQRQLEGTYDHDLQVGLFTWWHANGQKALEGRYDAGKQDGEWTWWYPNGQKSIRGEYAHGNPTGRWTWWKEDGRVAQSADLSHSEGVVIDTPKPMEPAPIPQVRKPTPRKPTVR
jgi:antitoxin component YwqK of YwqJK toxin-antitoxin module